MARISVRELKQIHGISQEDINLARATQKAQKKSGSVVLPLAVICGVQKRRRKTGNVTDPDMLLERQKRGRGEYGVDYRRGRNRAKDSPGVFS